MTTGYSPITMGQINQEVGFSYTSQLTVPGNVYASRLAYNVDDVGYYYLNNARGTTRDWTVYFYYSWGSTQGTLFFDIYNARPNSFWRVTMFYTNSGQPLLQGNVISGNTDSNGNVYFPRIQTGVNDPYWYPRPKANFWYVYAVDRVWHYETSKAVYTYS